MLVAIPTAIPELPLTSSCGSRAGSTTGSSVWLSKLGTKSTVSLSMSASMSSAARAKRASVYRYAAGGSGAGEPKFP